MRAEEMDPTMPGLPIMVRGLLSRIELARRMDKDTRHDERLLTRIGQYLSTPAQRSYSLQRELDMFGMEHDPDCAECAR